MKPPKERNKELWKELTAKKCSCEIYPHERAKVELDLNFCMDCNKEIK
tara:strand:+ start:1591 stop:1734 length:144 start_codon:yes stop_codon:yes gene_type:complete